MKVVTEFKNLIMFLEKNKATDVSFVIHGNKTVDCHIRTLKGFVNYNASMNLCSYLAYLSNLDISDSVTPQSGTFSYVLFDKTFYFRYSMLYSLDSICLSLRILYQHYVTEKLSKIETQNELIEKYRRCENGLILFSGPTGSGKTSSAYSFLSTIHGKEIYSIEDPIELKMDNVIQIQINKKRNLDYERGIVQLLRHDPDILFVGEIRDCSEAQMAVRAALTGHLVVSTIHSNSAETVIRRMLDLGVMERDFYDVIRLICNQRLWTDRDKNERTCFYEMMDEDEIDYYRKNQMHSIKFLSLEKQKESFE